MNSVKCFTCDIVIAIEGELILPKGELPPEVREHCNTPDHLFKKNVRTVAAETMSILREELEDSKSIVDHWREGLI